LATEPGNLIVFVKAPRPGVVKTRLAETIGPVEACRAYQRLVECALGGIRELPNVELRFTPDDAAGEIAPWLRANWQAKPQGVGNLGERLHRAFVEAFAAGARRMVVMGSDGPDVSEADLREAWNALAERDLVLGPAVDGGYWLIGLREPQRSLFEGIAWSTATVAAETLQRAAVLGLRVKRLRQLADVDSEADWAAFLARNGSG